MLIPKYVEIKETNGKGKGLFSKKLFKKNQTILQLNGKIALRPHINASLHSIQIDDDTYIDVDKQQTWQYINHSCFPNTRLDLDTLSFITIRDIRIGDEITYHYCTTEFDLAAKNEEFHCKCGFTNCLKIIKGFKHLTKEQKEELASLLIPYTSRKLKLKSDKIEIYPGKPKYKISKV
jgi:SET domain-containing protein